MMDDFYTYGHGYFFGFGWIFAIIFWGLVIWGVVALIHYMSDKNEVTDKGEDKILAILKERYAKGEISKDEYEQKKLELIK